jgi:hypothetical protein
MTPHTRSAWAPRLPTRSYERNRAARSLSSYWDAEPLVLVLLNALGLEAAADPRSH